MAQTNRYGLDRYIPSDVRQEIRRRSGFGCVVCGSAFYTYEHIDPTFEKARKHNPDNMALLCGTCQIRSSAGSLSKITIKKRAANPVCKQQGHSYGAFDLGDIHPLVVLGSMRGERVNTLIRLDGERLLKIHPPEFPDGPFRLSARFYDSKGTLSLEVDENEWKVFTSNWDFKMEGRTITIREGFRRIALRLRNVPYDGIYIERMKMYYNGTEVLCDSSENVSIKVANSLSMVSSKAFGKGCDVLLDINDSNVVWGVGCSSNKVSFKHNWKS